MKVGQAVSGDKGELSGKGMLKKFGFSFKSFPQKNRLCLSKGTNRIDREVKSNA